MGGLALRFVALFRLQTDIYNRRGLFGLWHGLSAGIMKTVPKYITGRQLMLCWGKSMCTSIGC